MRLFPSKKQFNKWGYPSKASVIGLWLAIALAIISLIAWIISSTQSEKEAIVIKETPDQFVLQQLQKEKQFLREEQERILYSDEVNSFFNNIKYQAFNNEEIQQWVPNLDSSRRNSSINDSITIEGFFTFPKPKGAEYIKLRIPESETFFNLNFRPKKYLKERFANYLLSKFYFRTTSSLSNVIAMLKKRRDFSDQLNDITSKGSTLDAGIIRLGCFINGVWRHEKMFYPYILFKIENNTFLTHFGKDFVQTNKIKMYNNSKGKVIEFERPKITFASSKLDFDDILKKAMNGEIPLSMSGKRVHPDVYHNDVLRRELQKVKQLNTTP